MFLLCMCLPIKMFLHIYRAFVEQIYSLIFFVLNLFKMLYFSGVLDF